MLQIVNFFKNTSTIYFEPFFMMQECVEMYVAAINQPIRFCGVKTNANKQVVTPSENDDSNEARPTSTFYDKISPRQAAVTLATVATLGVGGHSTDIVKKPVSDSNATVISENVEEYAAGLPLRMGNTHAIGRLVETENGFEFQVGNTKIQPQETTTEAETETTTESETNEDVIETETTTEAETIEESETEETVEETETTTESEAETTTESETTTETEETQQSELQEITPQQKLANEYGITIDGVIDNKHNLGWHGDCYLVATLESLNASEGGRKLINDNITFNKNSVSVHFPGINYTSEISFAKLQEQRQKGRYSVGDDDILLLELAVEDAFTKIKNGEISAPIEIVNSINDADDVLRSGYLQDVMYLYTGQMSWETVNPSLNAHDISFQERYDFDLDNTFDLKMNNNDNIAMTVSLKSVYTSDAYHAYGVISVDKDNITVMDPIGSKLITYSRQELYDCIVDAEYCWF